MLKKTKKVAQLAQKLFNLTNLEERLLTRKRLIEAKDALLKRQEMMMKQ